jgi:hypothetical protein
VDPDLYWRLAKTFGKKRESQLSPVRIWLVRSGPVGQECMSLQRFGVTKVNLADRFNGYVRGMSRLAHCRLMFV